MQEYQNLVKSGESSDLGTAIQNLINDNLRFINTAFLAKIVKINTNTVDIQPILKQNASDKDLIINNCLIAFNHSQLWNIQHKLKVGDIGIALIMQNDISTYKQNGAGGVVATRRFKDFNDAIYIPLSLYNSFSNDDINYQIKDLSGICLFEFDNSFDCNLTANNITSKANDNTTIISGAKNELTSGADTNIKSNANMSLEATSLLSVKAQLISISSAQTSLKAEMVKLAGLLEAMASGQTGADGHGQTSTTAPSSVGKFSAWGAGLNNLFNS